jgi:nitroimidazol reductase NimA-like FMN-containing flavoprotein (pyridoxamine 5'-phosphate oxidase superfamily)
MISPDRVELQDARDSIMTTISRNEFGTLSAEEARAFLAGQHTGRIAYSTHDRVDIEPISYAFHPDWILGRTSVGTKLSTLAHQPWCAFEVDVVVGPFEWTSVVVHGTFHLLDPESGSPDVYARALSSVRALEPDAFSASDATPHRTILFGIYVNEITGRTARAFAPQPAAATA